MEGPRAREDRCRQEKGEIRDMLTGCRRHDRCCRTSTFSEGFKDLRLVAGEIFRSFTHEIEL